MTFEEFERDDAESARDLGDAVVHHDHAAEPDDIDYDAAFAALIAQFGDSPSASGLVGEADLLAPTHASLIEPTPPPAAQPWYPAVLDEHFEPDEPPPLLGTADVVSQVAWAGVLGGPIFLIIAAVIQGNPHPWMVIAAISAFVGGFVTLVARMPADRDDEDDDGAVV